MPNPKTAGVASPTNPTVLICVFHYRPSYKRGGPSVSIENTVSHLNDDFRLLILTHDRNLGDSGMYKNIEIYKWLPDVYHDIVNPRLLSATHNRIPQNLQQMKNVRN